VGGLTGSGGRRYRQFWSQAAQWALRKVDASEFNAEVALEGNSGTLQVEALDAEGNFRNFLNLQAVVVDPKGQRQTVRLEQKGPGRYEATNSRPRKSGPTWSTSSTSPMAGGAQPAVLRRESQLLAGVRCIAIRTSACSARLAEVGGGRVLDPTVPGENPFLHDRVRTHQPRDLWWWLCMIAVVLFPIDVGLRRVQLDREEWARAVAWLLARLGFRRPAKTVPSSESLSTLLARKDQVRSEDGAHRHLATVGGPLSSGPGSYNGGTRRQSLAASGRLDAEAAGEKA
jgi:Ca-activated chloride channel family protein